MAYLGATRALNFGATVASLYSMIANGLTFDGWKLRLREDCESKDKLVAYSSLGEECLKLLWELGTAPSVQGVVDGGAKDS